MCVYCSLPSKFLIKVKPYTALKWYPNAKQLALVEVVPKRTVQYHHVQSLSLFTLLSIIISLGLFPSLSLSISIISLSFLVTQAVTMSNLIASKEWLATERQAHRLLGLIYVNHFKFKVKKDFENNDHSLTYKV